MTANASAAPAPSFTRASATVMPTGPATVAELVVDSGRPRSVQTAPAAPQSAVAGSVSVTSWNDRGRTVIVQRWFCPCATRLAPVTRPLVTRSASSLSLL